MEKHEIFLDKNVKWHLNGRIKSINQLNKQSLQL